MDKFFDAIGKIDLLRSYWPHILSAFASVSAFIYTDKALNYLAVFAFPLLIMLTIQKFLDFRIFLDPKLNFSISNFAMVGELLDNKIFKGRIIFNISNESRRNMFYKVSPIAINCSNNPIDNSDNYTNFGGKIRPLMQTGFRSHEFEINLEKSKSVVLSSLILIDFGFDSSMRSKIAENIKIELSADHKSGHFSYMIWNE